MMVFVSIASAQVVNGDFEGDGGWSESSYRLDYIGGGQWSQDAEDLAYYTASPARGTSALTFYTEPFDSLWGPWFEYSLISDPFVVTREQMSYALIVPTAGWVTVNGPGTSAPVLGPASPDTFTDWQIDVSSVCGTTSFFSLFRRENEAAPTTAVLDDVRLTGAPCPGFADLDADGWCPEGVDLDGDGACAELGETGAVGHDCDDADAAIGPCLALTVDGWLRPGLPFEVEVTHAPSGAQVKVLASLTLGPTCKPSTGLCMDLGRPHRNLGEGVADATGTVTLSLVPPLDTPPYAQIWLQAVVPPASGGPMLSDVVGTRVRPIPGPAADPGVPNGDFESTGHYVGRSELDGFGGGCGGGARVVTARGHSLQVTEVGVCSNATLLDPFRITHQALSWATSGPTMVTVGDLDGGQIVPVAVSATAADGFVEWVGDVSASCGLGGYVELDAGTLDDVALDGPVCPAFVDDDGDGTCAEGVDLDGDGACVGAGEVAPMVLPSVPVARRIEDFEGDLDERWYLFPYDLWAPIWSAEPTLPAGGGLQGLSYDPIPTGIWASDLEFTDTRIVTHEQLVISVLQDGFGDYVAPSFTLQALDLAANELATAVAPLGAPSVWHQVSADLAPVCGATFGAMTMVAEGWEVVDLFMLDPFFVAPTRVYVDDLGFAGPVCPEFVDNDGDGACAEGLDLDADGTCVSDGEPTPGVAQDPDEA